jgi:hypothetical protein
MRGRPALPVRIGRLAQQRQAIDLEAEIAALAAQYGLHPEEVRQELTVLQAQIARSGRLPIGATIRQLATEFDLDEDALWAEYREITARREGRA